MEKSLLTKLTILFLLITQQSLGQSEKYDMIYASDKSGNHELYLVSIDGKRELKITDYELRDGYVEVSPDGKKIVSYAYHDNGETWSIHLMNLDGSARKRLTNKMGVWDACPNWSHDGELIIFSRKEDNDYKVMVMNKDGSNLHALKFPFAVHPRFTNDYRVIYASHWEDHAEIFIADSTGQNIKQLTHNNYQDGDPVISPDESKIVFFSTRDGNSEIYTMNMDGTDQKRLTYNEYDDWTPSWSPDASKIAFNGYRNGIFDIYIMNKDGSDLQNITNSEWSETGPCWLIK